LKPQRVSYECVSIAPPAAPQVERFSTRRAGTSSTVWEWSYTTPLPPHPFISPLLLLPLPLITSRHFVKICLESSSPVLKFNGDYGGAGGDDCHNSCCRASAAATTTTAAAAAAAKRLSGFGCDDYCIRLPHARRNRRVCVNLVLRCFPYTRHRAYARADTHQVPHAQKQNPFPSLSLARFSWQTREHSFSFSLARLSLVFVSPFLSLFLFLALTQKKNTCTHT